MSSFFRLTLFVSAFMLTMNIQAQHHSFVTPRIWLAADSVGNNNYWQDISGNGYHAYSPGGAFVADSGLFNYQPCLMFDSLTEALRINYIPQESSRIIVFAVFDPEVGYPEEGIWSLRFDSSLRIMVSTQHFGNFYSNEQYRDSTMYIPTINLLRMSWPYKAVDTLLAGMNVVGTDSLTYHGRFAEFMFYDTTLKHSEIERIHTYLAIKYGISVKEKNYVNSQDSVLWNYKNDSLYSNHIAGIGKDSLLLVNQKQSCGLGGKANLAIASGTLQAKNDANTSPINELDYLIWGDNGKELMAIVQDIPDTIHVANMSECKWLMKRSGLTADDISTQVVLSAPEYAGTGSIQLVINRSGDFMFPVDSSVVIFSSGSDTAGHFYFNNVVWDTDGSGSDAFGFQFSDTSGVNDRAPINNVSENNEEGGNAVGAAISSLEIYPNPSTGNYSVEIKLKTAGDVQLSIQDESGKIIMQKAFSGFDNYIYNGNLEEKGCYLIKAESGNESKTGKLIVQ
jgi:hypothetical protein